MENQPTNWFTRIASGSGMNTTGWIVKLLAILTMISIPCQRSEAQAPATSTAALSGQVMTQYGTPAASSMVRICPITSGGIPCFPSAQLYSDYLLTQPVDNPLTTDQFGNYKAFLANGIYAIQISLAGSNAPTFIYFASVGWGGGTVTSVSGLAPLFITVNPTTSPTFQLLPAGAHQFFGNSSGSSGTPGYVQPSFTDLLGTASASQLVLAVLLNPSTTQTVTEPSGNSFNFITSGGGKLNYNGSEVITALNLPSNLILSNPVVSQTITEPSTDNFSVNTSGGGRLLYNGNEVLTTGALAGVVELAPASTQTITQPVNTNLNVVTSGSGQFTHNGNNVLDTSTGVAFSPTVTQTVSQPLGTTLQATNLNTIYNAALATGSDIGAKINGIITSCAGAVCPIYIPAGTFTYTTPIVLASNVELFGAGEYITNLFFNPGSPANAISGTGGNNVRIHDLGVSSTVETPSNLSSYNGNFGIQITSGAHVSIDKVHVSHFWGLGFGVLLNTGTSYSSITNSDIEYNTYGAGMGGSNDSFVNNYASNHYTQAHPYEAPNNHYWAGIIIEGSFGALVDGNTLEDNGDAGVFLGSNTQGNTINAKVVNNHIFHNWNRGIDAGVTGDVNTTNNSVIGGVVSGNDLYDNAQDNIWLICDQNFTVTGNYSVYTSNYATFFGSSADPSRSNLAVGDTCGSTGADLSTYVTASANVLYDYTGTVFATQNVNLKALSINNYFMGNVYNRNTFISGTADLTQNVVQLNPSSIPTSFATTPTGTCATPSGYIPVQINGVTLHLATCP